VNQRPSPVWAKQVHSNRDPMTSARMGIVPLIQSLKSSEIPSPRAMPWAIMLRPFRASVRSARFCPMNLNSSADRRRGAQRSLRPQPSTKPHAVQYAGFAFRPLLGYSFHERFALQPFRLPGQSQRNGDNQTLVRSRAMAAPHCVPTEQVTALLGHFIIFDLAEDAAFGSKAFRAAIR
jgi:hypothetical protein